MRHGTQLIWLACTVSFLLLALLLPTSKTRDPNNAKWGYAGGFWRALFVFRNTDHKGFCITSSALLSLALLAFIGAPIAGKIVTCFLLLIHGSIAARAYSIVIKQRLHVRMYSVDCIWFNSFLVLNHIALLLS